MYSLYILHIFIEYITYIQCCTNVLHAVRADTTASDEVFLDDPLLEFIRHFEKTLI